MTAAPFEVPHLIGSAEVIKATWTVLMEQLEQKDLVLSGSFRKEVNVLCHVGQETHGGWEDGVTTGWQWQYTMMLESLILGQWRERLPGVYRLRKYINTRVGYFKWIDLLKCFRGISVKIRNCCFGYASLVEICWQNWSKCWSWIYNIIHRVYWN